MIITQLTLENYKQYRGEHIFRIAEDATIGIVGANGTGKTTIFEAIEWCLYKPRSIPNHAISPHGVGGEARVVVQLTSADRGEVFEVERTLKRNSTQATIYRMDELGNSDPIVQGTREVTNHITARLIGLSHSAFVATFFTRQKELGFFENLRPAERRREVGKLLGLETIKQAQALIGDERGQVRAEATTLQRQYDDRIRNRDLKTEIAAANDAIAERQAAVEHAGTALAAAEEHVSTTEATLQQLQDRRDRHTAISSDIRNLETQRQNANDRQTHLRQELGLLDQRQLERGELATRAQEEPALRQERQRLETERDRFQERQRLEHDTEQHRQAIAHGVDEVRRIVETTPNPVHAPGWTWTGDDDSRPLDAIDRLHAIATSVDLKAAEARLEGVRAALSGQQFLDQETVKLQRYLDRRQEIQQALETLLQAGEPDAQRATLETRQHDERKRQSDAHAVIGTLGKQQQTSRELADRLSHQHFDETCPTCGRAFSDEEADVVIHTLRASVQQQQTRIDAARSDASDADRVLKQVHHELQQLQKRESEIRKHRASLESSQEHISQQQGTVDDLHARQTSTLNQLGRTESPAQDDLVAVEKTFRELCSLVETGGSLQMVRRSIDGARQTVQAHQQKLATLTDIAWDADRYREIMAQHDTASRAASAVEQIDQQLARRPQLEHDLATTQETIRSLTADIAAQTQARDAIGFDPATLQTTTETLQHARQAEREQREAVTAADRVAREAAYQLESLRKDEQQLADLEQQATAMRQRKDELDLMYDEFSAFDQYVASQVTPQLAEMTSDIVAEMTDGTYDRVVFGEDYGIEVFDQTGDRFPLETFSGGERDAIALAARLALSRMIGSQAANPPGFMVLDEVFGSLDAERRERVLNLLGQHSHEFFRQMFIISHVDDVQQSPVFDAIWLVTQCDDGSSDVQRTDSEPAASLTT